MARLYHRPVTTQDWAEGNNSGVFTSSGGNVLGDNNDGTYKQYRMNSGSVGVYGAFGGTIPAGREIIAVRAGHRQRNTGAFGLYNGWVCTYLRVNGARQASTKAYKQFPYQDSGREVLGAPLYKKDFAPWTLSEINTMSTDSGSAVGTIGPNRDNYWCACSETFVQVIFDEPIAQPSILYPAHGATINTSSVDFRFRAPAPQEEQPVRAIIQVARNNSFTQDVRIFEGSQTSDTTSAAESKYTSKVGTSSFTDLGPGLWYARAKSRDHRGPDHESGWGPTTQFTVVHGALPTPILKAPISNEIFPTPYGIRGAALTTQHTGGRKVGVTWQFANDSGFTTGVVQWTNTADGAFTVPDGGEVVISYDAQPTGDVEAGLNGRRVSSADPSQYITQGARYARVRATDAYGQSGAWSAPVAFQVLHRPVVADSTPKNGQAFDQYAGPVRWKFADPWVDDQQGAYSVAVIDPTTGSALYESPYVRSTQQAATIVVPDTFQQKVLRLIIRVFDAEEMDALTPYETTFKLALSPVVTLPFPAIDEQIVSGQPEISWSSTFSGGSTQQQYRIQYLRADTGVMVYDSGVITSSSTSHIPPQAILRNLTGYQLVLTVGDTAGLATTVRRNFSTNFLLPGQVTGFADAVDYVNGGYVTVYFPSAVPDPYFFEWRIYRRRVGSQDWIYAGAVQDPAVTTFRDWLASGSGDWEYSITQAATRFGSMVESEHDPGPSVVTLYSDSYWLIMPGEEESSVRLRHVTGDKLDDEEEVNEYVVVGSGRRQNVGTTLGIKGSLSVSVRHSSNSASEQLAQVRRIAQDGRAVLLRDPYGNVTRVKIGSRSFTRLEGVGPNEFGDLEIPYTEVR